VAQAALDYDAGLRPDPVAARLIEENLWRATRYGLDGRLIDLERLAEVPACAAVEGLLDWSEDARAELRLDPHLEPLDQMLDSGNGAQRQWRRHEAGDDARQIYADIVAQTCETYAETPAGVGACAGGHE
jgi:carboxylate-amine ligase